MVEEGNPRTSHRLGRQQSPTLRTASAATRAHSPGIRPDNWVRLNRYQQTSWREIVTLWSAYNRHLATVIESLDDDARGHVWHSPEGDVTLEFIATDYVRHLLHHLKQIGIEA